MEEIKTEMKNITKWLFPQIKNKWLRKVINKIWWIIYKKKIEKLIEKYMDKAINSNITNLINQFADVKDIPYGQKPVFKVMKNWNDTV